MSEYPEYDRDVDVTPRDTVVTRSVKPASRLTLESSMAAIGEAIGKMRADLRAEFKAQLEGEVLKLRAEFLERELDRERGTKRLKVVPPLIW